MLFDKSSRHEVWKNVLESEKYLRICVSLHAK